jgi:hypothetical protein
LPYDRRTGDRPLPTAWKTGDHLAHRHNPELGIGRVSAVEGRTIVVEFPSGKRLRLAASAEALERIEPEHLSRTTRRTFCCGSKCSICCPSVKLTDSAPFLAVG